jgi:hypothetical protein
MRTDSDIDVFLVRPDDVDPDHERWLAQLETITEKGRMWTGNAVNVLEFSESEIAANIRAGDRVLGDIERDGIVLHGPVHFLSQQKRHTRGYQEVH